MTRQLVRAYRPEYAPDGVGGRSRTWLEHQTMFVEVSFGNTRDGITGRTQVEQQEATVVGHRWTPIKVDDRLKIGGVEFVVVGVDPLGPAIKRKFFAARVEHEEIPNG